MYNYITEMNVWVDCYYFWFRNLEI